MNSARKDSGAGVLAPKADVQEATPLPTYKIAVLGMILSANNCSIWLIFTMIPFMVQHFFPELDTKELGFRAGILGSAFSIGSLFGNFIWGILSDKIGRKPVLIMGLLGSVFSSLLFGFSTDFRVVVLARFFWGLLNGNIGVSKTYMAEILDDSNNSKGMALYGTIGGVGRTIGPIIGGYLLFPAKSAPGLFKDTIFDTYPFSLPVSLVAAACATVAVLAYFKLPETLPGTPCYVDTAVTVYTTEGGHPAAVQMSPMGMDATVQSTKARSLQGASLDKSSSGYAPLTSSDLDEESMHGGRRSPSPVNVPVSVSETVSKNEEAWTTTPTPALNTPPAASHVTPRRSVGFANVVMVKTIGSNSMAYGPLKRVGMEEVPVEQAEWKADLDAESDDAGFTGGSDMNIESKVSEESEHENEAIESDALDVNAPLRMWGFGDRGSSSGLEPQPGPTLDRSGDYASPRTNTPSVRGDASTTSTPSPTVVDPIGAHMGLAPNSNPAFAKSQLRFSNGSEFYSTQGGDNGLCGAIYYLLTRRQIFLSTFLYGLVGFYSVFFLEIFPLWVVTAPEDGGFSFSAHDIGWSMTISGPISILSQMLVYPRLADKFGVLKTYQYACFIFFATSLLMPMISLLSEYIWLSKILLVSGLATLGTVQMWIFISIFTFINNSCYSHQRATVNGIGQTFAALGRLAAPYFGATLFAWSETNGLVWPFNYSMCWYIISALALWSSSLASYFPKSIQRRKREPKKPRYASPGLGGGSSEKA